MLALQGRRQSVGQPCGSYKWLSLTPKQIRSNDRTTGSHSCGHNYQLSGLANLFTGYLGGSRPTWGPDWPWNARVTEIALNT